MSEALHWFNVTLSGRLRIEASAGTGKTWTMAALYLRLLLEDVAGRGVLRPERIVVATFSEAAAQDLGARLRARLQQALNAVAECAEGFGDAQSGGGNDPVHDWLHARWRLDPKQRERDRQRLLAALAGMDRAPIGTLHALCHRILREYPLDGRLGFLPLQLGEGRIQREGLARDLLRRIAAGEPPPAARQLPAAVFRLAALEKRIGLLLQPGAVVSPPADPQALRARFGALLRESIKTLSTRAGHYGRADARPLTAATALRDWFDGNDGSPPDVAALIGTAGLSRSVLEPAEAILRDASFQSAMLALAAALQTLGSGERAFWAWWQPVLRRAQAAASAATGMLAFDQLVERVCEAVQRGNSTLPAALAERWPVVLIDEFQDTDAAQYALLDAWHRGGSEHGLFAMIGDPKQAIYRFRGGDIAVYLRAAAEAQRHLSLTVNRRSNSRYVEALQHVFAGERARLSSGETPIAVEPVTAAGLADTDALHLDGLPVRRPLVLHAWSGQADSPSNAQARPLALGACAELVIELLQPGRARLGVRPLVAGDLAVLLVSNAEIDALRRMLRRRGVPVIGQARRSVFDGDAARDLGLVLRAVLHPGDVGALRAALLTPLVGPGLARLPAFEAEGGLEAFRQRCMSLRTQWLREGVLAVVHALLRRALPRLGREIDGERWLTDLRHLGELLQAEAAQRQQPQSLLDWLDEQRRDEDEASGGECLQRLESDVGRVRLLTLHASKGLEFPVVLLPTLWTHEHNPRSSGVMLDSADADGRREVLFEDGAIKARRGLQQDERFRLLYVALTRAQQACHLFTLPEQRPAKAGGKAWKTDPERSALDALLARWPSEERGATHPCIEWRDSWPQVSGAQMPEVQHDEEPSTVAAPTPKSFTLPRRYSFSWLSAGEGHSVLDAAAADDEHIAVDIETTRDEAVDDNPRWLALSATKRESLETELLALASVRGKGFGNALHELLERSMPEKPYVDDPVRVLLVLRAHGVRRDDGGDLAALVPRIAALLDRALTTPLHLPGSPVLAALGLANRRAEIGFHFRLDGIDWASLRALTTAHGEPALIPPVRDARLVGGMDGFIDLVFEHHGRAHVLDWKGNSLPDLAAATAHGLRAAMDARHYRFQALLYTVALHRLLRQRHGVRYDIEHHLGAPVYVFLRAFGLAPQLVPELGVWTQAFPPALIEAVDAHFAGGRA